jgi:hypothetical protein
MDTREKEVALRLLSFKAASCSHRQSATSAFFGLHPHLHPLRFCLVRTIRYLAVPVSLVKLLKVLNRGEV